MQRKKVLKVVFFSFTTSLNETLTPIFLRCHSALELLEEIKMLNESMNLNDERVSDANKTLEDSMETREMVKFNLSSRGDKDDLVQLKVDLEDLNVTSLNGKVRSHHRTSSGGRKGTWPRTPGVATYTRYPPGGGSLKDNKAACCKRGCIIRTGQLNLYLRFFH